MSLQHRLEEQAGKGLHMVITDPDTGEIVYENVDDEVRYSALLKKHKLAQPVPCFQVRYYNPYHPGTEYMTTWSSADGLNFTSEDTRESFSSDTATVYKFKNRYGMNNTKVLNAIGQYVARARALESGEPCIDITAIKVNAKTCGN